MEIFDLYDAKHQLTEKTSFPITRLSSSSCSFAVHIWRILIQSDKSFRSGLDNRSGFRYNCAV